MPFKAFCTWTDATKVAAELDAWELQMKQDYPEFIIKDIKFTQSEDMKSIHYACLIHYETGSATIPHLQERIEYHISKGRLPDPHAKEKRIAAEKERQEREKAAAAKKEEQRKKKEEEKAKAAAEKAKAGADDIRQCEIRVGKIVSVNQHPDADSLFVEQIDVGESQPRTIVSGLVKHYSADQLVNRSVLVWCNLKPAKLRGVESNGMVLCADDDTNVALVNVPAGAPPGALVCFPPLGEPAFKAGDTLSKNKATKYGGAIRATDEGVVVWGGTGEEGARFTLEGFGEITSGLKGCAVR
eukprot:TRINITY_DN58168_c0_g1_i1.p3 TRINITY_DN58168_c0_g1~~TRINITY_DN58168_c0_g1_i1.p3  ORF type:complete len:299 (-),score=54.18 TRINITY_DN58168_c0_g1_i1:1612-2508(-)